jgi:trehalose-phosphatase
MRLIRSVFDELERVTSRLDGTDRVLIALDYDGTLAPIAATPQAAAMAPETAALLSELVECPKYSVAVVSGRSIAALKQRLSSNIICVGNHGLEIEGEGISYVHEGAESTLRAIDCACWDLEAALQSVRGVTVERKQLSATVHFRQAPPDLSGWIKATVNATVRPYLSIVHVTPALEALEIRPRLGWNKGCAVRLLLEQLNTTSPGLICAGDDVTDEDMFGILRWEISIKIGSSRNTRARFHVRDVPELLRFLRIIADRGAARCRTPDPNVGAAAGGSAVDQLRI